MVGCDKPAILGGNVPAYRLYWREGSGSLVAEVALALCGAAVERIHVADRASQRSPDFLAINPAGQIPVLILPDGTILTETSAIVVALADAFPESGILPPTGSAARSTSLRWLMYMATTGYPAALRTYYSERYTGDTAKTAHEAVRRAATAESDKLFAILAAAAKGPFLLGETVTMADVYLAMLADWHPPALENAAISQIYHKVQSYPIIGEAWMRHEHAG
jgi:glutathione S-transferase